MSAPRCRWQPRRGNSKPSWCAHDKVYTYQDYLQIPDDQYRYEILDGMLVREPAPVVHHQRVGGRMFFILTSYFAEKDPAGEVFCSPIDMTLSEVTVMQPDLIYIPGRESRIVEEKRINGAPYLVVEVISPSSRTKDRIRKRAIYERLLVPHYWIVDPAHETIEAYAWQYGVYVLRVAVAAGQAFRHPDFPDLFIDLAALWRRGGSYAGCKDA